MNIDYLRRQIEYLSEKVHDAWWEEKKKQGFHAPKDCTSEASDRVIILDFFKRYCDKCHTDMYPYEELPENIKDYDRVTVNTVLDAIESLT